MTKRPPQIRQKQLFQAIQEYLQNAGLIQNTYPAESNPDIRKLELTVRSLNLQRLP